MHRQLTFHPFVGSPPEPIDMPFGVQSDIPDIITHATFFVNLLSGFSAAAPRKVPFPTLIRTTITTVLRSAVLSDLDSSDLARPLCVCVRGTGTETPDCGS